MYQFNIQKYLAAIALLVFLFATIDLDENLTGNYQKIIAVKTFLSLKLSDVHPSNALQDGIPDDWAVEAWGGAREKYDVITYDSYSGSRAASIEHTNQSGAATLTQQFSVLPQSTLIASIFTKGNSGAIRIQFWDESNKAWSGGARKEVEPSSQWYQTTLELSVPAGTRQARILLYADKGLTLFDNAYVGLISGNQPGDNLLTNADFEEDGILEDPLIWWQSHVSYRKPNRYLSRLDSSSLAYLNLTDLINKNFSGIHTRAQAMGRDCALYPDMTSYLLSWGEEFNRIGGAAAEERLYQVAITLAPNCPRPYAALANLYKSSKSFWKASNLYVKAAELSVGTILEGKYAFEAGLIEWMYTGELDKALLHLKRAEEINGWALSQWEQGAATYYLARTLEDLGRNNEAVQAYMRLIECKKCDSHHEAAKIQIENIRP